MRSAPSVTYPVGRSAFLGWLLVGAGAAGLAALLLGVSYQLHAVWLIMGLWVFWVAIAGAAWRRQAVGQIAWKAAHRRSDGHSSESSPGEWVWISGAYLEGVALNRVERVYDLQAWMLLRLHNPDGARIWAWVERSRDARRWDDLRRAVMAHA